MLVQIASRATLAKRLIVAVPVFAAALIAIIAGGTSGLLLTFASYFWIALVQLLSVRFRPWILESRYRAVVALGAFWAGPTVWLWCAVDVMSSSRILASLTAPVLGACACLGWHWASVQNGSRAIAGTSEQYMGEDAT
jgi:hypothetical protein